MASSGKPGKTDLKQLMDLDEIYDDIFDSKNRGRGAHSMDSMPPNGDQSFENKMLNENMERQKQMKPLQGKIRNNVNMSQAMNGGMPTSMPGGMGGMGGMGGIPTGMPMDMQGMSQYNMGPLGGSLMSGGMMGQHVQRNSGSLYPSTPRMNYPPQVTNSDFNEQILMDAQNYKFGPKAYSLANSKNSYQELEEEDDTVEHFSYKKLHCIDVANHIKSCPICSKFYDNDKTMYVIAIIILVIICIILMKKVLENYEK